jgi:hypothetical protein
LLITAVPPSILMGSPATLPTGADGQEGPPSTKFYELRDNLQSTGALRDALESALDTELADDRLYAATSREFVRQARATSKRATSAQR